MANYCDYIPYNKSNVDALVPAKGGVYKISKEKADDSSKVFVVYVGKTDDLHRQLTKHLSTKEDNVCLRGKIRDGSLWISWAEVSTEAARTVEETDRIKYYKPACSVQRV